MILRGGKGFTVNLWDTRRFRSGTIHSIPLTVPQRSVGAPTENDRRLTGRGILLNLPHPDVRM